MTCPQNLGKDYVGGTRPGGHHVREARSAACGFVWLTSMKSELYPQLTTTCDANSRHLVRVLPCWWATALNTFFSGVATSTETIAHAT